MRSKAPGGPNRLSILPPLVQIVLADNPGHQNDHSQSTTEPSTSITGILVSLKSGVGRLLY